MPLLVVVYPLPEPEESEVEEESWEGIVAGGFSLESGGCSGASLSGERRARSWALMVEQRALGTCVAFTTLMRRPIEANMLLILVRLQAM